MRTAFPVSKTDRRHVPAHFYGHMRWTGKGSHAILEMAQDQENIHSIDGLRVQWSLCLEQGWINAWAIWKMGRSRV